MAKKRRSRKSKKMRNWSIGIFLLLILVAGTLTYLYNQGFVIGDRLGEEGYELTDPQLLNGQINSDKITTSGSVGVLTTSMSYPTHTHPQGVCWNGNGDWHPRETINNIEGGLTTSDGSFTIKGLYLEDFKAEVFLEASYACRHGVRRGDVSSSISTNLGWSFSPEPVQSVYSIHVPVLSVIELIWDDPETGHYQLYFGGRLVKEGIADPNQDVTITMTGRKINTCDLGCRGQAEATMWDLRSKEPFGCDTRDGEYLASRTFTEREDYTINNLRGFKRFCPEIAAIRYNGSAFDTSNRVYYRLNSGGTEIVPDEGLHRLFYIADGEKLGVTDPNCPAGQAYDYEADQCYGVTGIIDLCDGDLQADGSCLYQVRNLGDRDLSEQIGGKTLRLQLSGRGPIAHNNGNPFFTASTPTFTGVSPDGIAEYPDGGVESWTFGLNGFEFEEGDLQELDDFFTAELIDVDAIAYTNDGERIGNTSRYAYTTTEYQCIVEKDGDWDLFYFQVESQTEDLEQDFDYVSCEPTVRTRYESLPTEEAAEWVETYDITVRNNLIEISATPFNGIVELKLNNKFPEPLSIIIGGVHQMAVNKEYTYDLVKIPTGESTHRMLIPSQDAGVVTSTFAAALPINNFNLLVSNSIIAERAAQTETTSSGTGQSDPTVQEPDVKIITDNPNTVTVISRSSSSGFNVIMYGVILLAAVVVVIAIFGRKKGGKKRRK